MHGGRQRELDCSCWQSPCAVQLCLYAAPAWNKYVLGGAALAGVWCKVCGRLVTPGAKIWVCVSLHWVTLWLVCGVVEPPGMQLRGGCYGSSPGGGELWKEVDSWEDLRGVKEMVEV